MGTDLRFLLYGVINVIDQLQMLNCVVRFSICRLWEYYSAVKTEKQTRYGT